MSNIAAGAFNFWLGKGEIITLVGYQTSQDSAFKLAVILIPYFVLTEYIPSIVFVYTIRSFHKVIYREP